MTDVSNKDFVYDKERPWYRDASDDPSRANWINEFFDPTGRTRKPVFLRGQVLLFLFRTFCDVIFVGLLMTGSFFPLTLIAGITGNELKLIEPNTAAGAVVFLVVFTLAAFASVVSHARRLRDSNRSPFWALLVPIPMVIAFNFFFITILSPMPEYVPGTAPPAAIEKSEAGPAQAQRRGPRRPPVPMTSERWISTAYEQASFAWLIAGIFIIPFTFFFVARGKSDIDMKDDF